MVKAVIFDIGNVLVDWSPERHYERTLGAERARRLFAEVDLHGMNRRVDLGHDLRRTVENTAGRHPDWADEIRDWHDRWLDLFGPVYEHSVSLLRALRRSGIPVWALSNFGAGTFEVALRQWPFLGEFDRAFVSGRLGLIKPDPAIYAALEDATATRGPDLFFTDDQPDNIAAADARGWRTHLFRSSEELARRLVAERLLAPEEAAPPVPAA